ncbi:MAG: methyltransferase domain-containing protein [Candidatus Zixiibacteriota bacterium]|nr:MAG: methyltransferase domain-containing protein [candidate division Zixibacteria bacterium]
MRKTHSISSQYLHGTDPEEQERLTELNRLLNDRYMRELDLRGGERILEVGSGLAQLARAMARTAGPQGYVLGIERSFEQIAEARRQAEAEGEDHLVELRQGDVLDMPLLEPEWESFDVAHARYILEHVPDPLTVVRAMVRAVRPGGRIILADDDHDLMHLHPEPPGFAALWQAFMRSFENLGNDPYVGRRLVSLLYQAGAQPVRNTVVFLGSCSGDPHFETLTGILVTILQKAREAMVGGGLIDADGFETAVEAVQAWGRRPDAGFWYSLNLAEGRKEER